MTTMSSTNTPKPIAVTLDRVVAIMREFGIELSVADSQGKNASVASANLNGYPVMFALLDSVLIVRTDKATETTIADGDPRWHLACNQVNCFNFAAKAVVMDRTEKAVVRAEKDIPIAAGLNDIQLSAMLKNAIDHVLAIQDAVEKAVKDYTIG
ncbi:YbjN domain-containing protein [Corynebacterium gallinarum]|uniref:YbjN domain-containing protein n=1 Tax=Corynebacterium gallinarum TaxID=2762214 RepID=A0A8I0LFQ5_9CORY|nr:YbjN domain-containing protein [Corynebacterium gallinarum]MBD8030333.1 YbjN domain-containing protein [Corynebacterium gallinarum]